MTKTQYAAKLLQLTALQTQMVALAIELEVPKTVLANETLSTYDELMKTVATCMSMMEPISMAIVKGKN